jgi:hypothetical protein
MNPDQKAYAKKISDLRVYIRGIQDILNKLIRECNHLIVCMKDFGGAYCDICGESFGWYCEESPTKYCDFSVHFIECKYCGQPRSRK